MRYKHIELNGYKRMALNKADKFSMVMSQAIQLIIGTNGSGKSSLLREISPLPAVPLDFFKTGSKVVEAEHRGSSYVLKSTFFPTTRHSFIKDSIQLNDGGTITVQKDLVKTYFGITPDIQDLMLGLEKFHQMSASRRKEWFIVLCDTSYDYAIKAYSRLKEKHRDTVGAIKLCRKRLVQETEKLINSDEEDRILREVKSLHDLLNNLQDLRRPIEDDYDVLQQEQTIVSKALSRDSTKLISLVSNVSNSKILDEKILIELIDNENKSIQRAKAIIDLFSKQFNDNQIKINILHRADKDNITSLKLKSEELTRVTLDLKNQFLFDSDVNDPKYALTTLQNIKSILNEIFNTIGNNEDKKYSQLELNSKKQTHSQLTISKKNLIEVAARQKIKIDHMLEHKEKPNLQCPSCRHSFSLHYNEVDLNKNISARDETLSKLDNIDKELQACELYIQSCTEYSQLYRQYVNCLQGNSILQPYWDYLSDNKIITNNPSKGTILLDVFESDLIKRIQYDVYNKSLEETVTLLTSLENIGSTDLSALLNSNENLNAEIEKQTLSVQSSLKFIKEYSTLKSNLLEINKLNDSVALSVSELKTIGDRQIETVRRTYFNNAIKLVHSTLGSKEHILNASKVQKSIVDNISVQIEELSKDEKALNLLISELSPTDGLIAEGLFGFIRVFIHQMNHFIKSIWSYRLEVQSCEMTDDGIDLDYKFPLLVESDDNVVNDVSKGSTGMIEVVDLAFRIIAIRYLGLQDFPLYLDEFGASFDETHRLQSTTVIKSLIENQTFTQLFIVSHYQAAYGALSNAEICILNDLNIAVPKDSSNVNKHITIS